MSPNIAALLCGVFILWVFILDVKKKPNVSLSHWIPFLWFLILSSRPVAQWFIQYTSGATESTEISGNIIDATILSILMILGVVILSGRIKSVQSIFKDNPWLVLFTLYCGISILWSDYPLISMKRWFRSLGLLIMVLVVLTETEAWETVKTMFRRCAYLMMPLSIILIKYFRNFGVYYGEGGGAEYCGVTTHKNHLGHLCYILGFYFIWELFVNRKNNRTIDVFINIVIIIMIIWLLRTANSATSLASLIVAIFMLMLLYTPIIRNNIKKLNVMIIGALFTIYILYLTIGSDFIFSSLGRDTTFTGRTELWNLCFQYAGNPIIGVGYDTFWYGDRLKIIWDRYWWHPIQAHNGYLEIFLELGIIGLILVSGIILSAYKKIRKSINVNYKIGSYQLIFLFIFLLNNVTENAFHFAGLFWFTFLILEFNVPSSGV